MLAMSVESATFELSSANESVVGDLHHITTQYEDTFVKIARQYDIGFKEVRIANPDIDPWLPGENKIVVIPTRFILPDTPRKGIVINVPEMRLYYYPKPSAGEMPKVITYPISIGRQDWKTPLGITQLIKKDIDPTWYPPESIREEHEADGNPLEKAVPPGPDNPLGKYALRLAMPGYLIHGTNKPSGVGMQVTHGCIRLFPEDIEALYNKIPLNTPVHIINQPYKAGWKDGDLYLEVHPPVDHVSGNARDLTPVVKTLLSKLQDHQGYQLDWAKTGQLASQARGIPLVVGKQQERSAIQPQKLQPMLSWFAIRPNYTKGKYDRGCRS